ncbi:MAG TPA: hypothetical protein ENI51_04535, partial [Candidatus Atribacteria bacterium]|nr:hypothetical protein [Candidatus Atribacteria bacterium]
MRFSEAFGINKSQSELDFVDIDLDADFPLFIDPYAISKRNDLWSINCHNQIVTFFQRIIDSIRNGDETTAKYMLSHLNEPNDTRLGLSLAKPQGKGVSGKQAEDLYSRLCESSAVKTGFLKDLSDCELLVPGISRDKISDMTTNIIRRNLIDYTISQCYLHSINITDRITSGFFWDFDKLEWVNDYFPLPSYSNRRIILVPKAIVRYDVSYDHREYYNHFVLNYLQAEHLRANTSLVRTLKKGIRRVYKKDLKSLYPCTKEFLYNFSKDHPEVLQHYKDTRMEKPDITNREIIDGLDEHEVARNLIRILHGIPRGSDGASDYHNLMIGVLTFIFYPYLLYPKKEQEIHEGRKRIDIIFTNAAKEDFFYRLHKIHGYPCPYIMVECKNYNGEPSNPELDQLSGRFSPNR